jgi:predicted nucleic acid-binding protein
MVLEMLVLDSSVLVGIQKNDTEIKKRLQGLSEMHPEAPSITFINLFEYLIGLKFLTRRKDEALRLIQNFNILNTTDSTARMMSVLKFKYDKKGITLPLADLIIASLVIENRMILVTKDRDFEKIEELEKEII